MLVRHTPTEGRGLSLDSSTEEVTWSTKRWKEAIVVLKRPFVSSYWLQLCLKMILEWLIGYPLTPIDLLGHFTQGHDLHKDDISD